MTTGTGVPRRASAVRFAVRTAEKRYMTYESHFFGPFEDTIETSAGATGDAWAAIDELYTDAIAQIARLADGEPVDEPVDEAIDDAVVEAAEVPAPRLVFDSFPTPAAEDRSDNGVDQDSLFHWTIGEVPATQFSVPAPARAWDDDAQFIADDLAVSVGGLTLPRAARHAAAETAQLPRVAA